MKLSVKVVHKVKQVLMNLASVIGVKIHHIEEEYPWVARRHELQDLHT